MKFDGITELPIGTRVDVTWPAEYGWFGRVKKPESKTWFIREPNGGWYGANGLIVFSPMLELQLSAYVRKHNWEKAAQ